MSNLSSTAHANATSTLLDINMECSVPRAVCPAHLPGGHTHQHLSQSQQPGSHITSTPRQQQLIRAFNRSSLHGNSLSPEPSPAAHSSATAAACNDSLTKPSKYASAKRQCLERQVSRLSLSATKQNGRLTARSGQHPASRNPHEATLQLPTVCAAELRLLYTSVMSNLSSTAHANAMSTLLDINMETTQVQIRCPSHS